MKEEADKDVYQKVVDVAMKKGHQISKTDISICHRVPSKNLKKDEGRPIFVKFVRRQTKGRLMANKKITEKFCRKNLYQRRHHSVQGVISQSGKIASRYQIFGHIIEKVVIYKTDESKITFENLFKIYEWDPSFIYPVCKTSLHPSHLYTKT